MSDIEKLKELFAEFGIGFTETKHEDGMLICCNYGDNKVTGYHEFFTAFEFDKNGRFIKVGAWE